MNRRYMVTYLKNGKDIVTIRIAENAMEAVGKLCQQYQWRWKLHLMDAETRGETICNGFIDKDGGFDYKCYVVAKLCE